MIELKHVTTKDIVYGTLFPYVHTPPCITYDNACQLEVMLRQNSIEDFQALKDLLESGEKIVLREFLESRLDEVQERLLVDNRANLEPQIFLTNGYEGKKVDDKSIEKTEKKTKTTVLVKNPAICNIGKKGRITTLSIHELKHLLSHVTPFRGRNAFLDTYRGYYESDAEKLISALNLFEEQVVRQAQETKREDINLFIMDGSEKRTIVERDLDKVIEYLAESPEIFVWGQLSQAQKRLLSESISGNNSNRHQIIRKNVGEMVSNYTTLSEIKDGVKIKHLDRFVATKKR